MKGTEQTSIKCFKKHSYKNNNPCKHKQEKNKLVTLNVKIKPFNATLMTANLSRIIGCQIITPGNLFHEKIEGDVNLTLLLNNYD